MLLFVFDKRPLTLFDFERKKNETEPNALITLSFNIMAFNESISY